LNNRTAWIILVILALFGATVAGYDVGLTYPLPQRSPSFITSTQDGGYTMTYAENNCVVQLTLQQGEGGIWYQKGNSNCPTSIDESTAKLQSIINEQIAQHKPACFYFFNEFDGTTTFRYTTSEYCGEPWHSILVSNP